MFTEKSADSGKNDSLKTNAKIVARFANFIYSKPINHNHIFLLGNVTEETILWFFGRPFTHF